MSLSFDALAQSDEFDSPTPTGKPLQITISDIAEDPNNPRTEYDNEYLSELAVDIEANNVKSPVSIRANPTGETPWVLNFGSCRRRASILAGKATIPAFVDEQFTDYDAVAENEQRRNLSAMELALFIQKRLSQGDSQKVIAEKLHKDKQAITHHLALIDMPDAIATAYRERRLTTARTVYDLVKLHKQFTDEVSAWCKGNESITRGTVRAFGEQLKQPEIKPDTKADAPQPKTEPNTVPSPSAHESGLDSPKRTTKAKQKQSDIATFLDIPTLLVTVGKRRAVIVLERKPSARGMAWVRYMDDNAMIEVKASGCVWVELASADELEAEQTGEGVT